MTRTYSNMTRLRWLELDRSDNNAGGRCRRGPSLFGGPQDVFDDGHGVRASNTGRMRPQPHFWLGPRLANRPLCMGEWQEALSLTHPSAGLPLSRFAHVRRFVYLRQTFARLIHAVCRFSDI